MPQPLPHNPYPPGTSVHQAYATCRTLEFGVHPGGWPGPPTSVCARLLGYLIIYSPTDDGRTALANEINSCDSDNDNLHELAQLYINHFLCTFRQAKGRTPVPSRRVSRPSFDDMQEMIMFLLQEPPKDHRDAKAGALLRDDYRCLITGAVDFQSSEHYPNDLAPLCALYGVCGTECAHILTPSTSQVISGKNQYGPKHQYAATAWAVMFRMGDVLVFDELNGKDCHRLENVMTMRSDLHTVFDDLGLWLEATNLPNQYTIRSTNAFLLASLPHQTVTFTSQRNLPLPSARYLALHAACANVAHLSGAGEYINTVDRDIDTTRVLAEDGSSNTVLARAIGRIGITA